MRLPVRDARPGTGSGEAQRRWLELEPLPEDSNLSLESSAQGLSPDGNTSLVIKTISVVIYVLIPELVISDSCRSYPLARIGLVHTNVQSVKESVALGRPLT